MRSETANCLAQCGILVVRLNINESNTWSASGNDYLGSNVSRHAISNATSYFAASTNDPFTNYLTSNDLITNASSFNSETKCLQDARTYLSAEFKYGWTKQVCK
jgi:hypothetical protein